MISKTKLNHLETLTQNITGLIIAFIILKCFGISTHQSIMIQSVFFIVSYIRSYTIRAVFSGFKEK